MPFPIFLDEESCKGFRFDAIWFKSLVVGKKRWFKGCIREWEQHHQHFKVIILSGIAMMAAPYFVHCLDVILVDCVSSIALKNRLRDIML